MKKKRPTPKRLPSGSWRVQVMVNGKRISVTDPDKNVAQARAMAFQAGILEQEERKAGKLSLFDGISDYIERKDAVLSPSTIRGYRAIQKKRFPDLMGRNLFALTQRDLQRAVNAEAQTGASPKSIDNAFRLVISVLRENGVEISGVKLPQKLKPRRDYVQRNEVGDLLSIIKGDPCEAQILLALWLGMRRGEIAGLCWDCVDFQAGTITVRRVLVLGPDNQWTLREGAKNHMSQRAISCPDYILGLLRSLGPKPSGLVFSTHPNTILKRVKSACEKAGITSTTTHGLRHTNAAIMRALGVSDAHAMERGGWTEERTYKRTYSYVFGEEATTDDEMIDSFFTSKLHTDFPTK